MIRGTLRNEGFCGAWNVLVQLGCCDDTYAMEGVGHFSHMDFICSFIERKAHQTVQQALCAFFNLAPDGEEMKRLQWSGLFSDEPVGLDHGTPAQILEHLLNKKWKLNREDKDYIVMWHRFAYQLNNRTHVLEASLTASGTDSTITAMARTVGLPMAIAALLVLDNKIKARGVQIPTSAEFYNPILQELKAMDIALTEKHIG